jgi:hypothetical protein
VAGIFGLLQQRLKRNAEKEDRAESARAVSCAARGEEIKQLQAVVNSLMVADRTILYDRIKHLAKAYIRRGWIYMEEYEDLDRMHKVYHDELEGNGFLDTVMTEVRKLEKRVN